MTHPTSTAILLFARTASCESKSKVLANKEGTNRRLHDTLLSHSKQLIRKTGLTYYYSNEFIQDGSSFGERLGNALKRVFDQGHKHAIVIGSDCPDLTLEDIASAKDLVNQNKLVIGPDAHGGAYLIGIRKEDFDYSSFSSLKWNTSKTFDDLSSYASDISVLDLKIDLNTEDDVKELAAISKRFRQQLSAVFNVSSQLTDFIFRFFSFWTIRFWLRRGPPSLAAHNY